MEDDGADGIREYEFEIKKQNKIKYKYTTSMAITRIQSKQKNK